MSIQEFELKQHTHNPYSIFEHFMRDAAHLGVYAIAVYAALTHFAYVSPKRKIPLICEPSVRDIARHVGCGRTSVHKAIRTLEDSGWITVIRYRMGRTYHAPNRYHLAIPDHVFREMLMRKKLELIGQASRAQAQSD